MIQLANGKLQQDLVQMVESKKEEDLPQITNKFGTN